MIDHQNTPTILSQHTLQRAGCPLHYWVGGAPEGPWLVFMHGATMDHRMFNAQVEALAPQYRVLVWDARGHGQSQPRGADFSLERCAGDMLAILDAQGVDRAVLCGQSLGGYIAQHIYRQAPARVQALILIGTTPIAKAYSRWEVWALKASLPLFRLWPYGHFTQTIARMHGRRPEVQTYMLQAARQIPRHHSPRYAAVGRAGAACRLPGHPRRCPQRQPGQPSVHQPGDSGVLAGACEDITGPFMLHNGLWEEPSKSLMR